MSRRPAWLSTACLLAFALAGPAAGQSAVSAHFGENADAATGVGTGQTVSLGFTHFATPGGISLSAGIPVDPDAGTRWGSATGWLDRPDIVAGVGLIGAASGFGYHDPVLAASGGGGEARLQAYRELDLGSVRLRARGGGRAGLLTGGTTTVRRALGGGGADATIAAGPLLLRGSADLWAAEEGTYPEIGAVALLSAGRVLAHARVSRWLHDDLPDTGWAVGAEIGITDRLALVSHAARAATDILFFTPPQRSWSVGLRFGGGAPRPSADLPLPVIVAPGQTVRLQLSVHDVQGAGAVRVAGTFSRWQPLEMRRRGDRWVLDLRLEPGVYEFAFVAPDGSWFVPEGTPGRKADGFGGYVGTIVVR